MSEMSTTYWPVSLHPFCPLQFILYTPIKEIFLQGKAMHSNTFQIKINKLTVAHKAVKDLPLHNSAALSLDTFLPSTPPPSSTLKTTQFFHFLKLTLLLSTSTPSKVQIFSACTCFRPVNLLSQFLFILPVSELPLPQRNLSASPQPNQSSTCPVS